MSNDLHSMSRRDLEKLRNDVDKALATVSDRDRKAALDAAERAAAEHGFKLSELTGGAIGRITKVKQKSPAKYRNPANGDETWSGRGRKPGWIRDAESAGRSISDFLI